MESFFALLRYGLLRKLALGIVTVAVLFLIPPAHAAGVVSTADQASLLAALGGGGTVRFECDGTIYLTNTITISSNTVLDGNGHAVSISGQNAVRVFNVSSNVSLTILGVGILDGWSIKGGGIFNEGILVSSNCFLANNTAFDSSSTALGGAIYNKGSLYLTNTTFAKNSAVGGNGFIYGCFEFRCSASDGMTGYGGAIYSDGSVIIENSTFLQNKAVGGNGLGGYYRSGKAGSAAGGAVFNKGNSQYLNCTFWSNSVTGGSGSAEWYLTGNPVASHGGHSWGGAIFNTNGTTRLNNCTLSSNEALGGSNHPSIGAQAGQGFGGSLANTNGVIELADSLLAESRSVRRPVSSSSDLPPIILNQNVWGQTADLGFNISSDASCNFTNMGSMNSVDPKLGLLADNGGPTETMLLLPGSPAIDAGNTNAFPATDQRGFARPSGSASDIGAVEQVSHPGAFALEDLVIGEDATNAIVTVYRRIGYTGPASINYFTADGTASASSDYSASSGTLVFADGEVSKSFLIPILNDQVVEPDETITVELSSPGGGAQLGEPSQATVTITNDDSYGAVRFERNDLTVAEDETNAVVTIIRSGGNAGGGSVKVITHDSTATQVGDYVSTTNLLVFGENETTKQVFVPIVYDTLRESDETFFVRLSEPVGATLGQVTNCVVTIQDVGAVTEPNQASLNSALLGGGKIKFLCDGIIVLSNTITISTNTVLNGNGHSISISGGGTKQIFNVNSNGSLTLIDLNLIDGRETNGGAIFNKGNVNCVGCVFSNNVAAGWYAEAFGGAIFNRGNLYVTNCTFAGNQAAGSFGYTLTWKGYQGTDGKAAFGGGVYNEGEIVSVGCTFTGNAALGGGGGYGSQMNGAGGNAAGGAICNVGTSRLCNSTFAENIAVGGNNGSGGFPYLSLPANGIAGAVFNTNGTVYATNSTFVRNSAVGGTMQGAWFGSTGPSRGYGGSLANTYGSFELKNSIVSDSSSVSGAIANGYQTLPGVKTNENVWGPISDLGNNISSDSTCSFTNSGSLNSTDPKLGPLSSNGGLTETMLLRSGSPAIDAADAASFPQKDQRGFNRPNGAAPDIGAVEMFDDPGKVMFNQPAYAVGENQTNVLITVWRTVGYAGVITVDFGVSNGTAHAGTDYVATNGTLTFLDSEIEKTFLIPLVDDDDIETNETIAVDLTATNSNLLGQVSHAIVSITNDDISGLITFGGRELTVSENETNVLITVIRENGTKAGAWVTCSTKPAEAHEGIAATQEDYLPISQRLYFGEGETIKTFTVSVNDDDLFEATESFALELSDSWGATIGSPHSWPPYARMIIHIQDNDSTAPILISTPENQIAFPGDVVTFSVSATGTPSPAYKWFFNNTEISNATNSEYSLTVQLTNAGTYSVLVSNSAGQTNASATLNIPPVITTLSTNKAVAPGHELHLRVSAVGSPALGYQWQHNGTNIPGGTSPQFWHPRFSSNDAGNYSVIVSNSYGIAVSTNIMVTLLSVIHWESTNRNYGVWFVNGTSVSGPVVHSTPISNGWRRIGMGDFNRNGQKDFLWRNTNDSLAIWLMRGTNQEHTVMLKAKQGHAWRFVDTGDLNHDGHPDLLWQHTDRRLSAWLMNGTNVSKSVLLRNGQPAGLGWSAMATHDFTGDNNPDILFQHDDGRVALWRMNGTNLVSAALMREGRPVVFGWRINGLSDFNNDVEKDILFRHYDGRFVVWLMNGTNVTQAVTLPSGPPTGSGWRIVGVE